MAYDVVIVGGFGHVGLPLAIAFANKGKRVCALDVNRTAADMILQGEMPFVEDGAEDLLPQVLRSGKLQLSFDPRVIAETDVVIVVIGTPVDRHLNAEFELMRNFIEGYMEFFRNGQLVVLRSTLYPGTTERLQHWFYERGKQVELAFCPERIAEGKALEELETLPQIVSSLSPTGVQRSKTLFRALTNEIVVLSPIEAELAKLFTNVWRYIKFAAANQFFMLADQHGADFYRIYHAMTYKYERAADLARPGFAAGPCLFKDAMQLAAFNNNSFYLGHAAMLVNEGLPNYIVSRLKQKYNLRELTVGILGMAFKANIDDTRESLSFKLKKILTFESRAVLCSDVYVRGEGLIPHQELIEQADIVILGAPHKEYATLHIPEGKVVVDVWNMWGKGCLI
jgi:UDP-N-acetyl-D-mannosaminuronic acid dehydrogenase